MDGDRKDTETGDKEEYRRIEFAGRKLYLGFILPKKSVSLLISRKACEIICIVNKYELLQSCFMIFWGGGGGGPGKKKKKSTN